MSVRNNLIRTLPGLLLLLMAGCGYRAPMYRTAVTEDPGRFVSIRPEYRHLAALMTSDTGLPPTDSNTLCILSDASRKFELLLDDLRGAKESIYIDHYRIRLDSIGTAVTDILKEKAVGGADVRTIVDRAASSKEDRQGLLVLRDYGIQSQLYYRPKWLQEYVWPALGAHRDHRKIVLVDGRTAYLGSRNIQDKYLGWRDCDIRITGPAVEDLATVFLDAQKQVSTQLPPLKVSPQTARPTAADTIPGLRQYRWKTVQIVPDSPLDRILPIRNCFEWAINHARRYFYLYNPYTPPPASTLKALKDAAARGVDVRWIVPANNDLRYEKWMGESLYRELLTAGVKIYEWQDNVLHAKQFISDDYLTVIGSANLDNVSFFLNLEVEALVYDEETAVAARELFENETASHCLQVTLKEVLRWSHLRKLRNRVARIAFGTVG